MNSAALVFEHSYHGTFGHSDYTGNSKLPFGKMLLMPLDNKKQCHWDKTTQYASTSGSSSSAGPQKTLSPFPRANTPKVPLNCQHHPRKSWNQDFFFFLFSWSKVKWKFTMTFRLIHTHLTSFYSSCLRKARYTKFAEMRGGRLKKM